MTGTISVVERLRAIEEIKQLVARRIRCMDTKNWDDYPSTHAPDATVRSFGNLPGDLQPQGAQGAGVAVGRDAVIASVRKVVDPLITVHHAHMPEIEILSPTTARGIWAMEDILSWRNGDRTEQLHGWGHYHETYVKLDGGWVIQSRVLTRLRVETTPDFFEYRNRQDAG